VSAGPEHLVRAPNTVFRTQNDVFRAQNIVHAGRNTAFWVWKNAPAARTTVFRARTTCTSLRTPRPAFAAA